MRQSVAHNTAWDRHWCIALAGLLLLACSGRPGTEGHDAGPGIDAVSADASGIASLLWQPEQRLTDDPGGSWTTYNFARNIAADESGRVHAVYYDNREGEDQVYYQRSLDGGETWELSTRLSNAQVGGEHPTIAVDGDTVYVAWHDDFDDEPGMEPRILLRRSPDGGASFEPEVVLDAPAVGASHPCLAATGDDVHLTFVDNRSGNAEVYLRSSRDRGATWEDAQRLSAEPYNSWVPTVEAEGDLVVVGWVDYQDANEEEYLRRSTDGGRTFEPELQMTDNEHDSWAPSMAIRGDVVHFFWFDRRDAGVTDTDVENALDDVMLLLGLVPAPAPARDPAVYYLHLFLERIDEKITAVQAEAPAYQAGGGDMVQLDALLTVFYTRLQQWEGGWELYYRRSGDRGVTFGPDTRMTHTEGQSARPSVGVHGNEVQVAWFDGLHADRLEIYFLRSTDRGLTWEEPLRITDAAGESRHVHLAVAASGTHLLWYDDRHGSPEIYYRRAIPD